jgi:hypothetical protein
MSFQWDARILQADPPHVFVLRYFDDSIAAFTLEEDGQEGTDLTLTDSGVPPEVV